jgi:type 2 lantibiotic biosynthesis protein LanM
MHKPRSRRVFSRSENLTERARDKNGFDATGFPPDAEREKKKIRWWIDVYFGKSKSRFNKHLRALGIDPEAFIDLLYSDQVNNKTPPSRIKNLNPRRSCCAETSPYQKGGIGRLCAEYLDDADQQLLLCINGLLKNGCAISTQPILSDFRRYIYNRVADLIVPSLILEANISRLGASPARTPEKRFKLFLSSLSLAENKQRFWTKYPILERRVQSVITNATQMCAETMTRVANDRKEIEAKFGINRGLPLISIGWGSGDSHCQGRVVAILKFKGAHLAYKPRSMGIDSTYNQFINWFGQQCEFPPPKSYQILDLGVYGYAEFIKRKKANSKSDIATYYHKQGQLLALAWLLGITDLHHENLIASGNDPYLIDLETMFDRPLRRPTASKTLGFFYSKSAETFLFRTGLLPHRRHGKHGTYDTSAIGASGNQPAPFNTPTIRNIGRDDIKLVLGKGTLPRQPNKPELAGCHFEAHQYTNEIIQGFTDALDILQKHKHLLLKNDGPLCERRCESVPEKRRNRSAAAAQKCTA